LSSKQAKKFIWIALGSIIAVLIIYYAIKRFLRRREQYNVKKTTGKEVKTDKQTNM